MRRAPSPSRPFRLAAAVVVIALTFAVLASCEVSRVGRRCKGGVARDATHALVCRNGRWARGATLGQVAAFLVELHRRQVAAQPPAARVPSLAVTAVAGGLDHPWDIAFTPDGTMLATERSGDIDVVTAAGVRLLGRPPDVEAVGEGGMMGLAVDPAFSTNRRIYTCLRSTASGASDVRVVRWVLNGAYTSLSQRADIVTGIPAAPSHVGCRIRFGPDGYLWIGTGDALGGPNPQSPTSLGGKVLRVTTDGAGAPGNPGGSWDPRIHDIGHRNVQGLAFRPGDGQAYSAEHGPDRDDEVNFLVPGENYGWNPVPYRGGGTTYDQTTPMTDVTRIPWVIGPVWTSGSPTVAPSGATFVTGPQWGAWNGALVLAMLKGSQLRVLILDQAGTTTVAQFTALTDRGRLRSVVQGPDANLYVATDAGGGQILRVTPT